MKPLGRVLPPLIVVRADEPQIFALRATMTMLASEMANPAPGSGLVVQRLADIVFVQCLRAHLQSSSGGCNKGLLRAFFDPKIGVALKMMDQQLDAAWSVEKLASACGMSRSAFALRFKDMVGEMTTRVTIHNQRGELVLMGEHKYLLKTSSNANK